MTHRWQRGILRPADASGDDVATAGAELVVKLGGSLLARPSWPDAVRTLLAALGRPALLVVGGGAVVDGIRTIDAVATLPVAVTHLLAIDALGITARAVAAAVGLPVTADPCAVTGSKVLDTPRWLHDPGRLAALPVGWHVTSDTIAAFVAARLGRPLLLAKSVPPPSAADLGTLVTAGWIDPCFPDVATPVAWIGWAAPRR